MCGFTGTGAAGTAAARPGTEAGFLPGRAAGQPVTSLFFARAVVREVTVVRSVPTAVSTSLAGTPARSACSARSFSAFVALPEAKNFSYRSW